MKGSQTVIVTADDDYSLSYDAIDMVALQEASGRVEIKGENLDWTLLKIGTLLTENIVRPVVRSSVSETITLAINVNIKESAIKLGDVGIAGDTVSALQKVEFNADGQAQLQARLVAALAEHGASTLDPAGIEAAVAAAVAGLSQLDGAAVEAAMIAALTDGVSKASLTADFLAALRDADYLADIRAQFVGALTDYGAATA